MTRRIKKNFMLNPFMVWSDLAVTTGEMMLASAQVIHHRTGRMATAGSAPSVRDQREFMLMGQEKWEAMTESAQAMALQMMSVNPGIGLHAIDLMLKSSTAMLSLATSANAAQMFSRQANLARSLMDSANATSRLSTSAAEIAHHSLKPIHARATANAKRLAQL